MQQKKNNFCAKCGVYHDEQGLGPFFGRLFLSLIFILGGITKIHSFNDAVLSLNEKGIGSGVKAYIIFALILEIVGGLLILLGWKTRLGCLLLAIFLIPVTFLIHGFWNYEGAESANQMAHFLKNIAIFGGLFLLASYGPGKWSFESNKYTQTT